ncbi:MAG: hypothetical protein KGL39_21095 [Patescibacteria group bacterium]|nr:hypothetical protein [Patescibacteria group bacterium]
MAEQKDAPARRRSRNQQAKMRQTQKVKELMLSCCRRTQDPDVRDIGFGYGIDDIMTARPYGAAARMNMHPYTGFYSAHATLRDGCIGTMLIDFGNRCSGRDLIDFGHPKVRLIDVFKDYDDKKQKLH